EEGSKNEVVSNEAKQSFAVGGDYYEPVSSADSSLVVEQLIVEGVEDVLVSDFTDLFSRMNKCNKLYDNFTFSPVKMRIFLVLAGRLHHEPSNNANFNIVTQHLEKFKSQEPDAPLYLAHVFTCQTQINVSVRAQAGKTLKSALTQKQQVYNQQILQNVLQMIVQALIEENIGLRRTAGNVAASFVEIDGLENSFPFIAALAGSLDVSQPQTQIEGTVDCLLKTIEIKELIRR
ncbi:MAG: hypothetical protein EZS28_045411, partial [Streblomastix strix]